MNRLMCKGNLCFALGLFVCSEIVKSDHGLIQRTLDGREWDRSFLAQQKRRPNPVFVCSHIIIRRDIGQRLTAIGASVDCGLKCRLGLLPQTLKREQIMLEAR